MKNAVFKKGRKAKYQHSVFVADKSNSRRNLFISFSNLWISNAFQLLDTEILTEDFHSCLSLRKKKKKGLEYATPGGRQNLGFFCLFFSTKQIGLK